MLVPGAPECPSKGNSWSVVRNSQAIQKHHQLSDALFQHDNQDYNVFFR